MTDLSLRLKTIAALVPHGARVCDIGTDHGYLSIYLKQQNTASSVIATDLREKPLESARRNIALSGVNGIELRLCDGLSGIKETEADTVIIAGMGGEVIAGILSACEWIKKAEMTLILQPTTSGEALRRFLICGGFDIETEVPVSENGKLYSVMKCRFTGNTEKADEYFYYIGKVSPATDDGRLYIEKQQNRAFKCMEALKNIPSKHKELEYYRSVYEGITKRLSEV